MKPIVNWMKKQNTLHVETKQAIINIRLGLVDTEGRSIESVEIIPDRYAGSPQYKVLTHEEGEEKEVDYLRVRVRRELVLR